MGIWFSYGNESLVWNHEELERLQEGWEVQTRLVSGNATGNTFVIMCSSRLSFPGWDLVTLKEYGLCFS